MDGTSVACLIPQRLLSLAAQNTVVITSLRKYPSSLCESLSNRNRIHIDRPTHQTFEVCLLAGFKQYRLPL